MSLCRDTDCTQKTHYAVAHAYVKNFLESSRYVFALVFHGQSSPIYIGGDTPYESCVKFPHDRLHHIDVNFGTMYEYEIFKLL